MSPLPPLVGPASFLSRDEVARYSRHLVIPDIGVIGQKRLKAARVLVVGAGGLGGPALLWLAAAGIGTIGIVDFDDVELSNLQRQVIHSVADIGRPKVDSAADSLAAINPLVRVHRHRLRLDSGNAVETFGEYDLIVDGSDNFATRYLVNDAAELAGKPYVWGSIYRFAGQVSVFWANAPGDRGVTYRDLYPQAPPAGSVPSCAEGGVLGVLCGTIAALMGTEVIKLICGIGDPLLGRLLMYDALAMTQRTIRIGRDPQRQPVRELIDYDEFCGIAQAAELPDSATIAPRELRDELAAEHPPVVIDVREDGEWQIGSLPGARHIPQRLIASGEALGDLPHDRPIVLYCKTGERSAELLPVLHRAGLDGARHLAGGILAWARDIDPNLPTY